VNAKVRLEGIELAFRLIARRCDILFKQRSELYPLVSVDKCFSSMLQTVLQVLAKIAKSIIPPPSVKLNTNTANSHGLSKKAKPGLMNLANHKHAMRACVP